jgi:alginate O-acetyltransferase complex protein AlgI
VLLAFERFQGKVSPYRHLPGFVQTALTFGILLVTWVFFRAASLGDAVAYLGCMVGLGEVQAGAGLVAGLLHQPYYLGTLAAAAIVTWGCPQTWDWTRRITAPKLVVILALLWVAVTVMTTQEFNPFIYFIF